MGREPCHKYGSLITFQVLSEITFDYPLSKLAFVPPESYHHKTLYQVSPSSILSTNFHFQPSTATQSVSLMSINTSRVYFRQTNVIIQNGISGFFPDIKFQTFPWPGLRKFCFATVTLSLLNNITGNIMS